MHTCDRAVEARQRCDTAARLRFPRDRLSCDVGSGRSGSLPSDVGKLIFAGTSCVLEMEQWGATIISVFAILPR